MAERSLSESFRFGYLSPTWEYPWKDFETAEFPNSNGSVLE